MYRKVKDILKPLAMPMDIAVGLQNNVITYDRVAKVLENAKKVKARSVPISNLSI